MPVMLCSLSNLYCTLLPYNLGSHRLPRLEGGARQVEKALSYDQQKLSLPSVGPRVIIIIIMREGEKHPLHFLHTVRNSIRLCHVACLSLLSVPLEVKAS